MVHLLKYLGIFKNPLLYFPLLVFQFQTRLDKDIREHGSRHEERDPNEEDEGHERGNDKVVADFDQ